MTKDRSDLKARTALKKKNLKFFKQRWRHIHDMLIAHAPSSTLVFGDDGQPDIEFPGGRVYGGAMDAFVADQLEKFRANPKRAVHQPANALCCNDYAKPFAHRLGIRAEEEKLTFREAPVTIESYFLCILGIGLAGPIDALVEQTNCQALHVVDASPEFLLHSLEIYDWAALAKTMEERNGTFWILISNEMDFIARELRSWLRNTSPMAIDGATFFSHYQNEVLDGALDRLIRELPLALSGMGFFYDESLMIANTHHNLFSGRERVYRRQNDVIGDMPAFVVGTGPSLDKDLAFIRENQDKAVIISNGTALRSLLINAITPDIQIETENIDVPPILVETAARKDFRSVLLVASTTVDTQAVPFFDEVLYFFREPLTPRSIFCDTDINCLLDANITVSNGGISLAQEMGFKEIYLFGIDMGSKGGGLHHSKDSYHYTDDPIVAPEDLIFDIPMPANFGGTSMASKGFAVALAHIERSIRRYGQDRSHYNCSDGCRIEGARPLRSADIDLPVLDDGAKAKAMDRIKARFHTFTRQDFDRSWNDARISETYHAYLDDIERAVSGRENFDDRGYMTELMGLLGQPLSGPKKPIINLFTGTLFQTLIVMEYYLRRLEDEAEIRKFEAIFKDEFKRTVDELRLAADAAIGNLTAAAEKDGSSV